MVYNGSTHVKTRCSPDFLNYGYEPVLPHEDPDWIVEGDVHPDAKAFAMAMTMRRAGRGDVEAAGGDGEDGEPHENGGTCVAEGRFCPT